MASAGHSPSRFHYLTCRELNSLTASHSDGELLNLSTAMTSGFYSSKSPILSAPKEAAMKSEDDKD